MQIRMRGMSRDLQRMLSASLSSAGDVNKVILRAIRLDRMRTVYVDHNIYGLEVIVL